MRPAGSLRRASLAALILVSAAASLSAQPAARDTIDRIVAIVGSKVILASQVQERILTEFPGGKGVPQDPEALRALRRTILEALVNEEIVVQEAQRDTTIKVTDEEVTQAVDQLFRNVRSRYSSDEQFRKDLRGAGFQTLEEWRSFQTDQQRREFFQREFRQKAQSSGKLKPVPPTDGEVREYFDQNKTNFDKRSEAISFKQIIIPPRPKPVARARALALADSILQELRKGGDFAAAARRFSMDPGSKEQGGSLGWVRRGVGYDPKFEEAAFSLRPGQVSDPVESAFGFHLIQVERAQPAEVQLRHVLIMPEMDSVQADSARRLADQVHLALDGGASFDSLQRLYHDKAEEKEVQQLPLDKLPPPYKIAVAEVKAGGVTAVFQLVATDSNRSKFAILLVTNRIPAGEVRFEDVRDQIRAQLSSVLSWRKYLDRLKRGTYVEIRDS